MQFDTFLYCLSHSTIRYLSTARLVARYAISVPLVSYHHTLSQYRSSRSTIRYFSTAPLVAPYALSQYSTLHSTIRYLNTVQ
eukprot:1582584-Rhodomonas_salina.2